MFQSRMLMIAKRVSLVTMTLSLFACGGEIEVGDSSNGVPSEVEINEIDGTISVTPVTPTPAETPVTPIASPPSPIGAPVTPIPVAPAEPVAPPVEPAAPTPNPGAVASLELGYEVYNSKGCAVCHGDIAESSKRGASSVSIDYALEEEVEMERLSLTPLEVESVALALADDAGICRAPDDPGPVVMRRLSNDEYVNTIRDLLGVTLDPSELPGDSIAGNFTNVGSSNVNSEHALGYSKVVPDLSIAINDTNNATAQQYVSCNVANGGENCARSIIEAFIARAFRRDVDTEESNRFVNIYSIARDIDETPANALALAIEAILLSPNFNFIVEIDDNPSSLVPRGLTDFELATRLSYFLWASMPDDTLMDLARSGSLSDADVMDEQIQRMLADSKSNALVDVFFEQWMTLTEFAKADNGEFSYINAQLRADMVKETKLLFSKQFVERETDLRDLFNIQTTYVNERLANHYGLSGVSGNNFRERPASSERAGLLTQASFLSSTSKENDTSPVARGKWVLDQLLCESPRMPPPDVGEIPATDTSDLTLKQLLVEHRKNPACAACHESMDPIGLGLENFDQLGHFRTQYESGQVVDSLGELPDGQVFEGAVELSSVLESDPRYLQCVTEKFVSYARGALSQARDNCKVKEITDKASSGVFSVSEIIRAIVQDVSFTTRRTADEE